MILQPGWRKKGRRCVESDDTVVGFGMRDGMSDATNARVVPSLNMMKYCGEVVGSNSMSITVPARLSPEDGLMLRTLVSGGYGSLMAGFLLQCNKTKRPPSYLIVG